MRIFILQALRAKRAIEQGLEETQSRVNELTTINVNLASQRTKLEQELSIISSDYDEVSKELKVIQTFCENDGGDDDGEDR